VKGQSPHLKRRGGAILQKARGGKNDSMPICLRGKTILREKREPRQTAILFRKRRLTCLEKKSKLPQGDRKKYSWPRICRRSVLFPFHTQLDKERVEREAWRQEKPIFRRRDRRQGDSAIEGKRPEKRRRRRREHMARRLRGFVVMASSSKGGLISSAARLEGGSKVGPGISKGSLLSVLDP